MPQLLSYHCLPLITYVKHDCPRKGVKIPYFCGRAPLIRTFRKSRAPSPQPRKLFSAEPLAEATVFSASITSAHQDFAVRMPFARHEDDCKVARSAKKQKFEPPRPQSTQRKELFFRLLCGLCALCGELSLVFSVNTYLNMLTLQSSCTT